MREGAFTYHSNISLGKGFSKPWGKVHSFLASVADNSVPARAAIELFEGEDIPNEFFRSHKAYLDSNYDIYGWNSFGEYTLHQWVIPCEELGEEISRLEDIRPLPRSEIGPVILNIRVDFRLLDSNGCVLPYQTPADYGNFVSADKKAESLGYSRVDTYLSENSKLHVFLSVPFENEGSTLDEYVYFLNNAATFKLNPRMWKKWSRTRVGHTYKKRKIILK